MKKITAILAKEWHDKTYGNTYHNVAVYSGKTKLFESGFTYGYGDHYLQTAFEGLVKLGYYTDSRTSIGTWCDMSLFYRDIVKNVLCRKFEVRTLKEVKEAF